MSKARYQVGTEVRFRLPRTILEEFAGILSNREDKVMTGFVGAIYSKRSPDDFWLRKSYTYLVYTDRPNGDKYMMIPQDYIIGESR